MAQVRDDPSPTDDFETSLDHVCVAGLDGFLKWVNPSWTRTLGWTEAELMSRPVVEFVHPEDRASTLARRKQLRMGAAMSPFVNRYQCKDGSYRWFEWRSVAQAEKGLVHAAACDITERKLAEERLALSKSKGVAAGVAPVGDERRKESPRAAVVSATVLVVDDDPAIGGALRRVLRGHEVTVVVAAKTALDLLESGKRFDVIFCDLAMPGLSGMDFHNEIVRRFPDVVERVVFVSGGAFTPATSAFLERVTNPVVDKPFDPSKLRELVQRIIQQSSTT